jgi:hypothetical protein
MAGSAGRIAGKHVDFRCGMGENRRLVKALARSVDDVCASVATGDAT